MSQALLAKLESIRSTYCMGLMFCGLLRNPATQGALTTNRVVLTRAATLVFFPGQPIVLPANEKRYQLVIAGPEDLSGLDHMINQFSTMLLRNLILDSFELLKEYCQATGQLALKQSQPWYHFARLLRNAVTHDQCWNFRPNDLKLLPVTWHGKTIEASMQGQAVTVEFFGWFDGCELFDELYGFAKTLK